MPFPYVEASGTAYGLGFQHGRQAAPRIHAFVDYLVRSSRDSTEGLAPEEARAKVLRAAARFRPLFERYCPGLLDEVRGLADGADLRFEEALLLQIRGEVAPLLREEACTTFAVEARHTAGGESLIGQTSDMEPEAGAYFIVLHLIPDDGPRILMWTFAGQLGYHGLSEYGVAHFANSLSGGPQGRRHPGGLPHYPVKRRLYECRTRDEILALWRALPVCSSGNYMMAAGDPALFDVEVTPDGPELLSESDDGFIVHANHFLTPRFRTPQTDAASLPDSFLRQERMTALLRERLGSLDVEALKALLSDHHDHPCSICRHEETDTRRMSTVAGLIAEPRAGRLHVSHGNPCRRDWTCYSV
jgi:isopenicillin-N N-acyltransferase like protein